MGKQRWVVVESQKAMDRESKTFEKKILKEQQTLDKQLWLLGNQMFSCQQDAQKQIQALQKKYRFLTSEYSIEPIERYTKKGRPKKEETTQVVGFQIKATSTQNQESIETHLRMKGRFIIATNLFDQSIEDIFQAYRDQQNVERGFRFLKDPWFMVDSVFLKSKKRIAALMAVMTLCLMVYNVAQFWIREALQKENQTIKDQKGKPTQNPTLRWIFQVFEGMDIVLFKDQQNHTLQATGTNINQDRETIIRLLGQTAVKLYGGNLAKHDS